MAEVTIRLPDKHAILVKEDGVEVTAKASPPSMTYMDPSVQVGMEPMVAFMTYLDENPVELNANTARHTTNDVELSGSLERTVETDAPVLVEIEGATRRYTTNDLEITAPLVRNVTSYKVDLEYATRRDVLNSGDLEVGTVRHVEARIDIEAPAYRMVLNDEDAEIGIPSKEYGSFVEPNKLFRVQHDVLNEDVSDNPYFEKQISNLRNAALLTRNQTVIKAINELFVSQREAFLSTFTALEKVNSTVGDLVMDKELRAKYAKMGAENVIDGLVKLSANIDTILDFIGMRAESMGYYEELGYKDLLETLRGLNEKIKTIDFIWDDLTNDDLAWMFRSTDYIPEIKDQVFGLLEEMQQEIEAFKNGTTNQFLNLKNETELTLARQYQTLIEKMNSPYERITEKEVRDMFRAIGQEEIPDEDEDVYFQMFQSLAERLATTEEAFEEQIKQLKANQATLLKDLESWADIDLRDIREIFGDISENQDAQDVYVELFRIFSQRLDAQHAFFEQAIEDLEERIRHCEIVEDWAAITEVEVRKIFDLLDPDAEPDEDRYAAIFLALSERIHANRVKLEEHIEESNSHIDDYASITEEEIRRIFELFQSGETERSFEDYVIEIIRGVTDRLISDEEATAAVRDLVRKMQQENADISEEEVRRIFSLLKNEDETEEDFEKRLVSIIRALTDRVEDQGDTIDLLQRLIGKMQDENADISEEEVQALFAMLNADDIDAFKDSLTKIVNRLDERVEAQEEISRELKQLTNQLRSENANITEEEIIRIFTILKEDSESEKSFEERITSTIQEWQDRIIEEEDIVAELKNLLQKHLESGSDITREEVLKIFENLQTGEDEKTFEERIAEIVNALTDRVYNAELNAERLAKVAAQIKAENTDITQEEIMQLFAMIKDGEGWDDYETRISSIIQEWQDKILAERSRVDEIEQIVNQLKNAGIDITKEEVERIFATFQEGEDEEDFKERINEVISRWQDRVVDTEERMDRLETIVDRFKEAGVDITEEEVQRIFESLKDEPEETFEERVISAIQEWQDRVVIGEERMDRLEQLYEQFKEAGLDITEEEVKGIFASLQGEAEQTFEERIQSIIEEWQDKVDAQAEETDRIKRVTAALQAEHTNITEEEVRKIFEVISSEPEDSFEARLTAIIQEWQDRVIESESEHGRLSGIVYTLLSENASITEEEVKALFAMVKDGESGEEYEDRVSSIIQQWQQRITKAEETVAELEELFDKHLKDGTDLTEEEVRKIFSSFSSSEDEASFEERVSEVISRWQDRAVYTEERMDRLEQIVDRFKEAGVDITQDEIQRIFSSVGDDEDEESFEQRISAIITEYQKQVDEAIDETKADVAEIKAITAALQTENASITEEEVRKIFSTLQAEGETEESFEERINAVIEEWQKRVTDAEEKVDGIAILTEILQTENASITEDEVRRLFEAIQEGEDWDDYQDRISSIINQWQERVSSTEEKVDRIALITEMLQEEDADITEEEVRKIFSLFDDGDNPDGASSYEATISALINSLTDRIIAQEEESERLKQRIETLEGQIDGFNRSLDVLSRSITARVTNFTDEVNDKVRSILSALENAQEAIEGSITYDTLVTYLDKELASTKSSLDTLDNRVTGLEERVESAFTEDDISSVDDIKALFDPTAWFDDYEEASEDDIYSMFEPKVDEEGNPQPTTTETVQEILDVIVTEDDIMELFRPYIGDVEVHTMEELLEALANRNRG